MKTESLISTDINPKLYMSEKLYNELLQQVKSTNLEVTFVLHIEKENNNKYVVKNFYFPPQWNESAETKTLDSDYPAWCFELVKQNIKLNGHMHTHPNFSTGPSGYDNTFFKDLIKDTKTYQFRLIMNQKGFINCDLIDKINGFVFYEIPIIVECKGFNIIVEHNFTHLQLINANDIEISNISNNFNLTVKSNYILVDTFTRELKPITPLEKKDFIITTPRWKTNERIQSYGNYNNFTHYTEQNKGNKKNVQTSLFPDSEEEEFDDYYNWYSDLKGTNDEY